MDDALQYASGIALVSDTTYHYTAQHSIALHGMAWHGMALV